jgi:NAD(P)-dependent dehydrogenase (short-subunit alcohol dehydrogenase family)
MSPPSQVTVLITGANRGIGASIADELAPRCHTLFLATRTGSIDPAQTDRLATLSDCRVLGVQMDVVSEKSVVSAFDQVGERTRHLDVVVNNAGLAVTSPSAELSLEDWCAQLNVNLTGSFLVAREAFPLMKAAGSSVLVNMSSVAGLRGQAQVAGYAAAKGGVISLTRALAVEWARYGVRVVTVAPGYVRTEFNAEVLRDGDVAERLLRRTPARRFAEPREVARAVNYLSSEDAAFITGSVHTIDGGWCAQ